MREQLSAPLEQYDVAASNFTCISSLDGKHIAWPQCREHASSEYAHAHAPIPPENFAHQCLLRCETRRIVVRHPCQELLA
jgi:hypothetical protein